MIKGVNRQIIEVSDTGSAYFERALLIVRANCADADTAMLHDEAGRLVRSAGAFAGLRLNRRRRFWRTLWAGLGGGARRGGSRRPAGVGAAVAGAGRSVAGSGRGLRDKMGKTACSRC